MVIINYLFQLLLKKDTGSFFRLFFLKFKNLLDDYIVSYKVKYLFYSLFLFFFLFEFVFFVFSLYNMDSFIILYYLEDMGDLLFRQTKLLLVFYNLFYYLFFFFILFLEIMFNINNTTDVIFNINIIDVALSMSLIYGFCIFIFEKEYKFIFTFTSFWYYNILFFIFIFLSYLFPFFGLLLYYALFAMDEKWHMSKIVDVNVDSFCKIELKDYLLIFKDSFFYIAALTMILMYTFTENVTMFMYPFLFYFCYLMLKDYFLSKYK